MTDLALNWLLRTIFVALGVGAGVWILGWVRASWGEAQERWTLRIALGMLALSGLYLVGHARLLAQRVEIEAERERYAIFGDPRRTELRRAEVRGWLLDCRDEPESALAAHRERDGVVARYYPLGEAGANFIGGGEGAERRDYTIEVLFGPELREPRSFRERGELHPAGRDLRLTLCGDITAEAWSQLRQVGRPGAVVVQEARSGALVAYAATGTPEEPPFGVRRYSPPGSVFKLALAALWWEHGLPDDLPIPCPAEIQVTPRATIANFGRIAHGVLAGPTGMLVPSCNTAAVWMALEMRERLGSHAFTEAYRRFGFEPYAVTPPLTTDPAFWSTTSEAWSRRMAPAPSRMRISEETGPAEWAQLAIGQGPLDVTVMGISRFVQAIANDGVMIPPALEAELVGDPPEGVRVMSEATARRLQAAMREVVVRGTGRSAEAIMAGTGWQVGGKTGTAQVVGRADNGWFAGILFGPDGRPRYTVVAFVEGGGPGGGLPTSIAAQVLRRLAQRPTSVAEGGG